MLVWETAVYKVRCKTDMLSHNTFLCTLRLTVTYRSGTAPKGVQQITWSGELSMRRTRQGRPEALVSRATLLASLPVVKIRRQSTAFSMTEISTCIMMTSSQARETETMCVSLISSTQLVAHAPTVTKMLI